MLLPNKGKVQVWYSFVNLLYKSSSSDFYIFLHGFLFHQSNINTAIITDDVSPCLLLIRFSHFFPRMCSRSLFAGCDSTELNNSENNSDVQSNLMTLWRLVHLIYQFLCNLQFKILFEICCCKRKLAEWDFLDDFLSFNPTIETWRIVLVVHKYTPFFFF